MPGDRAVMLFAQALLESGGRQADTSAYVLACDQEFVFESETTASLITAWKALRRRMRERLDPMPHSSLDAICNHARMGPVSGRVVLLQAARHAAEHAGEARLMRQLILARRPQ